MFVSIITGIFLFVNVSRVGDCASDYVTFDEPQKPKSVNSSLMRSLSDLFMVGGSGIGTSPPHQIDVRNQCHNISDDKNRAFSVDISIDDNDASLRSVSNDAYTSFPNVDEKSTDQNYLSTALVCQFQAKNDDIIADDQSSESSSNSGETLDTVFYQSSPRSDSKNTNQQADLRKNFEKLQSYFCCCCPWLC